MDKRVGEKLATRYIDLGDVLPELKYGDKMTVKTEMWDLGKVGAGDLNIVITRIKIIKAIRMG